MTAERRGATAQVGVFLRGVAMGIAEVIPGVSGGTIAFISGIYDELLGSIARFGLHTPGHLIRHGVTDFWRRYNLAFLTVLFAGMVIAFIAFARLIVHLLAITPVLVWAFFFGLIAASVLMLGWRHRGRALVYAGLPGALAGLSVVMLPAAGDGGGHLAIFVGAAIAVVAWILPGISGSFVLLLMGLYAPLMAAVADLRWSMLIVFAAGAALGLLSFARAIEWLLQRYRHTVVTALTGVMAGSLAKLWPWQTPAPVGLELLSPSGYAAVTGLPAMLAPALAAILIGTATVIALDRFAGHAGPE